MDDGDDLSEWFSDRLTLTVVTAVSVVLGLLVVIPYLEYVLLGAVLAYVLLPVQRRLEAHVGRLVAAVSISVATVLAFLLPLLTVLAIALREAVAVATALQRGVVDVPGIELWVEETTGFEVDLVNLYSTYEGQIASAIQSIVTRAMRVVGGIPSLLIGLTVTVFVLFALLRDRGKLLAWLYRVLPVDDGVQQELFRELDRLMWASVVGNVAVAAIQAVLLGVALVLLDVPVVVFLTVTTFVLSLLPLVGAFGVWVPVSVYLAVADRPTAAALLVVYGSLVSLSDNYFRPALIGRSGALNPAIIVVGIFGGIVAFGAVGLFIGPVVLGGAKVTLDVFARERAAATGRTAPEWDGDDAVAGSPTDGDAANSGNDGEQGVGAADDADAGGEGDADGEAAASTATDAGDEADDNDDRA